MSLSDSIIRNVRPKEKPYRIFDGEGLYLEVSPAGGKLWRMKYRFGGKEKRLSFGTYPVITLKEARTKREEAKRLLYEGKDPGALKKAKKAAIEAASANTFESVAREWFDTWRANVSQRKVPEQDEPK